MAQNVRCTKPDCDCLDKAMEANGGNGVKSYPCLRMDIGNFEKTKPADAPDETTFLEYLRAHVQNIQVRARVQARIESLKKQLIV